MSSITSGFYSENLNRLNSRTDRTSKGHNGANGHRPSFDQMLGDLEKPAKNGVETAVGHRDQTLPPSPPVGMLSNLEESEKLAIKNEELAPTLRFNPALNLVPAPTLSIPEAVKPSASGVKESTPSITDAVPKRPTIVEVDLLPGVSGVRPTLEHRTATLTPPSTPRITSARILVENVYGSAVASKSNFSREEIKSLITTAGEHHGVDPFLSIAVANAESNLKANAISRDGHASKGIFQLLDSTAKDLSQKYGIAKGYDPYDPAVNAYLGVGYLRELHELFSADTALGHKLTTHGAKSAANIEKLAVAAFNSGQGNVAKAQARAKSMGRDPRNYDSIAEFLPASTQAYVAKVSSLKRSLSGVA